MPRKKAKVIDKKEELPSFLSNLKNNPENAKFMLKHGKNVPHAGPIFFGCHQYHPQPHSLDLNSFHHTQYMASSKENMLSGMFLPKTTAEKVNKIRKPFRPVMKSRRKAFTDLHPHHCPGTIKVFKPDIFPLVVDVGETVSIIETEISREIPFPCWIKRPSSDSLEADFELVTLSDIWEKERNKNALTYKERMAHTHFPKEFVTLRVIGPPIPGAITITKLPSKRKTDSEIDFHLLSKRKSSEKYEGNDEEEEERVEMQLGETSEENALSFEEEESLVEEVESSDKKQEEWSGVTEENDSDKHSEENLSDTDERKMERKQKSVTFEDEDGEVEENSEEGQGMEPNTQEEEGEENPTEEMPEE